MLDTVLFPNMDRLAREGAKNETFLKELPQGRELTKFIYHRCLRDYLKTVKAVDDGIGKVLGYLEENGLLESTVVINISDQGFYLGEHGWYNKRFLYEESFNTPLSARFPREIHPGTKIQEMDRLIAVNKTGLPDKRQLIVVDLPFIWWVHLGRERRCRRSGCPSSLLR